ncbi:DNA polymerase III subunit delta' [Stenomitos frigidus]|uniref:DNA polymerase III subunit delta n=1 Tax=Stenomitos frigidus ULC18 TaxID=2107698 RepID=A0A2T1E061_9CYAN|nr:DNA polymerase III subunit delta' [Stenomitos frigidus]PSB26004.1 DNA polymerase III subunit delta' [Stenomitos frigidus ULC18]
MPPFAPLIEQTQAVELLTQSVAKGRIARIAPAYLFAGPPGVGRRLAAECFLSLLFSPPNATIAQTNALQHRLRARNHPDLLWVAPTYLHQGKRLTIAEAAEAGLKPKSPPVVRLEQVREIARFLSRAPLEASRSMVVIDHAETMAEGAANGLLKTLEEPGQATLILIAPGIESLLPTLVSRCQRIPFYRLTVEGMAQVLQQAGQSEILQHPEILQLAQGSPGAAIVHWQQLRAIPPDLLQAITQMPRTAREALSLARDIDKALESEAQRWLIDYLQQTYWQQSCVTASQLPNAAPVSLLEQARQYLMRNVQPRLVWEVTLMGMVQQSL